MKPDSARSAGPESHETLDPQPRRCEMKPRSTSLIPALLLLLPALASPPAAQAFDGCHAADVDGNGVVNFADISLLIANSGSSDPRLDLDGSGVVDAPDWYIAVDFFQVACPTCPGDLDGDGDVDADDRGLLEDAIDDPPDCRFDLTRDGIVDADEDIDTCVYYFQNPFNPPSLRCDFNGDGNVSFLDISLQVQATGTDCRYDLNKDGTVDTTDIWFLLCSWGTCPGTP